MCLALFFSSQLMFGLWGMFATRDVPVAFVFCPLIGWAGLRFGAQSTEAHKKAATAAKASKAGAGKGKSKKAAGATA